MNPLRNEPRLQTAPPVANLIGARNLRAPRGSGCRHHGAKGGLTFTSR
mgnify:CR=1 FL=1